MPIQGDLESLDARSSRSGIRHRGRQLAHELAARTHLSVAGLKLNEWTGVGLDQPLHGVAMVNRQCEGTKRDEDGAEGDDPVGQPTTRPMHLAPRFTFWQHEEPGASPSA